MSAEERIELKGKLAKGLKESFEKLQLSKKQLGESIVSCDENGNVITLIADEARNLYKRKTDKTTTENLRAVLYAVFCLLMPLCQPVLGIQIITDCKFGLRVVRVDNF